MSQYTYQKRAEKTGPRSVAEPVVPVGAQIPNSVLSSMLGDNQGGLHDLARRMQVRAQALGRQIPSAEQEADRLSAGVTTGSFEQVKAEMGRRLGADLSDIRLHTDGAASAKADEMGAAAYTSGRDIYFGSGGYNAGTAAHELVHTAQQGVVSSGQVTASAPMGTVQMEPLSLKNKRFAYRKDKEYQNIARMVKLYNKAEGGQKALLEAGLMNAASQYITANSTNGVNRHKGRRANLEELILQLSTQNGEVQRATNNINRMRRSLRGKDAQSIEMSLDTIQGGITGGEANGRQLSPAMRAIMTETMASQDRTEITPVAAGNNGFHPDHQSADGANLNIGNSGNFQARDAAALLHEATHAQIRNTYGSIVAANDEEWNNPAMMAAAEAMRAGEMDRIADALSKPGTSAEPGAQGVGIGRVMYGMNGLLGSDYLDNAVAGAEGEMNDTIDEETSTVGGIIGTLVNYSQLNNLRRMRQENGGFQGSGRSAYLVEHDPALNEHLMNYEMNSTTEERSNSAFYNELKAAALRAHVGRHNELLRRRMRL